MRILYIHQHFRHPSEPGGTRSWEFARRLVRDGHSVTILAGGQKHPDDLNRGLAVNRVQTTYGNHMSYARRILSFLSFMIGASYTALRSPCDLVIATSTPLTVAVPGIVAKARWRAPFVFEVRDVWPEVPIALGALQNPLLKLMAKLLERAAYIFADHIIALSPGMEASIAKRTSTPITVIPNGSDIELFNIPEDQRRIERSRRNWQRRTIVYAGSLGRIYRPEWLAHLAVSLAEMEIDLICFGEGSHRSAARSVVATHHLDPDAVFPGSMPKEDIARIVAAADAIISSVDSHPALEAASINKIFDACAAGRPIFVNHRGWLSELISVSGAGLQVDDIDTTRAAEQIALHIGNRPWIEKAQAESLRLGLEEFDRERLYERMVTVLHNCVARDVPATFTIPTGH